MSKKEIEDVLTRINEKLLDINNLYEKLENSYSINKAFIDENSDDSLKKLVNDELAIIKSQSNDVSKMLNQLQESFEFLTSLQNNGKNRIQYIYDLLSDKVLEDIKEKSESFYKSYNEVFNGENGDLAEDFITKYEKINNLYKKLYENNNDKQSVSEELEEKIDNFFETYSILIKNDDDNSIYNEFIKKNDDFNNKKIKLDSFYNKIFGNEKEDTKSLNNELEQRMKRLQEIEEEAKKIISLSSDAGLAGGFHQKVKEVKINKYVSLGVFVIVLIIMGVFNFNTIDFDNLKEIDVVSIITRFMINLPFLWIATVANINLNKYTKLEQEYSHKESLAKSFERYKTEIEKLDNIDSDKSNSLMISLMELNIEAFKVNPANSIDKIKSDSSLLDVFQRKKE
ncbi:hypothetical protein CRU87_07975 [Aliarcobacter trophiarum LMG 25534]|uniref:Membrane protein n=1 Tax=Aliarcobacter trophiarum LMG 25534 TaxID=1032241 RepID=A0AAD0QIT1_9BACT|nr:hypothetical protein [Aliarcobacter trophiarum]AXK48460.1 putative membrane protein [Aliarcobacter trophiarum LMG 25534]RXJ90009.1 hypothetical protein CRU87_07975 [Aliarcobacter trophiarum LMG 25534]